MVGLVEALGRFARKRVMLIGDLMLDTYTIGRVKRISPEAPVPILFAERQEERPGGAGNVALNLAALGADVLLIGRIGEDASSIRLQEVLTESNIQIKNLIIQSNYTLPVKNRLIADNQQMMRVDFENNIAFTDEEPLLQEIASLLDAVDIIAFSDYGKGFLTPRLLQGLILLAKERSIPVIVDPKGSDFSRYVGATLIKPNLQEAIAAAHLSHEATLEEIAAVILEETLAEALLITRSEEGISLFQPSLPAEHFPVRMREVKDVTGAGDTALAMLALAIANGFSLGQAATLANIAAGIAIERFGCARITLAEVASRLFELDVSNKIFDEGHLATLRLALEGRPHTVLQVSGTGELSQELFHEIRKLSQDHILILFIEESAQNDAFITLLASLQEVDFILLQKDAPLKLTGPQ